jgi:hypothetical protein
MCVNRFLAKTTCFLANIFSFMEMRGKWWTGWGHACSVFPDRWEFELINIVRAGGGILRKCAGKLASAFLPGLLS